MGEPSSGSVYSDQGDRINPILDQYLDDLEISSVDSNQPGLALFNPDSKSENEGSQNTNNDQYDLDHYLISPDAIPDPDPYLDSYDSDSQKTDSTNSLDIPSSQDNFLISPDEIAQPHPMFGALNYDNFLLGPDDIASGIETNISDNYSDEESSNEVLNEFEFNDMYIDDDINSFQVDPNHSPELSPVRANFDPENDSDLDHYLLGPDGIYLDQISESSFDSIPELDPESPLGPVDPG